MDVVSVLEHTIEVQVDNLRPSAPPPLARMVDHLMALADDGPAGATVAHDGASIPPTCDSELAQGEAAMAMGLSAFEAAERLRGLVDAAQLGALTRLHASAQAVFDSAAAQSWVGRTPFTVHEMVVLEVTAATGLGAGEVGCRLDLAVGSQARVGFLRDAVAAGLTTLRRACRLLDATRELGEEAADTVARSTLAPTRDGSGLSDALFSRRMRRSIIAVDPDREASRKAARKRVGAYAQIFDDGTGKLTITNDAEKIAAAIDRADLAARAARAQGDPRTLDQLRADFLTDAATFGWPDGRGSFGAVRRQPAGSVRVVMAFSTLCGYDDAPCELPGHGWVSARHAREIATAEGSTWQALLADVDTGRALALSRKGYRPTPEMIEHVRAVDGICRGPGCQVRADRCDIDHDIPWPEGPTDVDHLSSKDRKHHRVRTTGLWSAVRHPDDSIEWRTAAGRRYITFANDWFESVRPNQRASDQAPPIVPTSMHMQRRASKSDDPPPF